MHPDGTVLHYARIECENAIAKDVKAAPQVINIQPWQRITDREADLSCDFITSGQSPPANAGGSDLARLRGDGSAASYGSATKSAAVTLSTRLITRLGAWNV